MKPNLSNHHAAARLSQLATATVACRWRRITGGGGLWEACRRQVEIRERAVELRRGLAAAPHQHGVPLTRVVAGFSALRCLKGNVSILLITSFILNASNDFKNSIFYEKIKPFFKFQT